jgi:hypothetical protein
MRSVMGAFVALFLGAVLTASMSGGASAAQQSAPAIAFGDVAKASPLTKVTYREYCVRQYFKCRNYSDNGWQFRRCMKWRGCWEAYVDFRERREYYGGCRHWKNSCGDNWGFGSDDYYGCLRYHGCD